jgi:hypothetical protein
MKKINKRAIELSVNFIVVMILGLATFSLASVLTYNMFSKSYIMKKDIDAQTKTQIGSLLTSGQQVAMPVARLQIQRGKNDVVGIGILNTEDTGGDNFFIEIIGLKTDDSTDTTKIGIYNQDGTAITDPTIKANAAGIKLSYLKTATISLNKNHITLINIMVDSTVDKAVYTYLIKVHKGNSITGPTYSFPQKLTIEVK